MAKKSSKTPRKPPPAVAAPTIVPAATPPATPSPARGRRIAWKSVTTVLSAAILIGAEVFGAAFAGGWAVATLFDLGQTGVYVAQTVFFIIGMAVMVSFVRNAQKVEPFTADA